MALFIKENNEKKITIEGVDTNIASVYIVCEFAIRHDGKTVEVAMYKFANKSMYLEGKGIHVAIPSKNLTIILDDNTELSLGELYRQIGQYYVDELGYDVDVETKEGIESLISKQSKKV